MKKLISLIAVFALVALALVGCVRTPAPTPTPAHTPIPSVTPLPTPNVTMTPAPVPGVSPAPGLSPAPTTGASAGANAEATAQKITDEVDKISEIASSAVVVIGDTALVGVQFDAQYKGELTTRIKDMVAEKAKAADSNIKKVAVSADADILTRVQAMMSDIKTGKSVTSEFGEIVNRLTPSVS